MTLERILTYLRTAETAFVSGVRTPPPRIYGAAWWVVARFAAEISVCRIITVLSSVHSQVFPAGVTVGFGLVDFAEFSMQDAVIDAVYVGDVRDGSPVVFEQMPFYRLTTGATFKHILLTQLAPSIEGARGCCGCEFRSR